MHCCRLLSHQCRNDMPPPSLESMLTGRVNATVPCKMPCCCCCSLPELAKPIDRIASYRLVRSRHGRWQRAHLDPRSQLPHLAFGWASTASASASASLPAKTTPWVRKYPSSETHRRPVGYNHLWHGPGPLSATQRTWSRPSRERESTASSGISHRSCPVYRKMGSWLFALSPGPLFLALPCPASHLWMLPHLILESSRHLQTCHGISGLEYLHRGRGKKKDMET